jgi:hypothetical protein
VVAERGDPRSGQALEEAEGELVLSRGAVLGRVADLQV